MANSIHTPQNFRPYELPLKIGTLIVVLKIILSTVQYQFFAGDWLMLMVISAISFLMGVGLLIYLGILQRKALGGYIDIKQGFQALFIPILMIVLISNVWDIIYIEYIAPDTMDKIKEASLAAAERMGAPEASMDQINQKFEEQESLKRDIPNLALGYFKQIIGYSIVGFIIAAAIAKKKPQNQEA